MMLVYVPGGTNTLRAVTHKKYVWSRGFFVTYWDSVVYTHALELTVYLDIVK